MKSATQSPSLLASLGGDPIRKAPMPARRALGPDERAMIEEAIAWYQARDLDPGYQGQFEALYCQEFVRFMGAGYADAVATGTAALFVALAALDLPKKADVLVSPITDPGTLSAIVLLGLRPKLLDTRPDSYNVGLEQVKSRLDGDTRCVLIVHAAGQAAEIDQIVTYCHERGVKVLEDCSQAHGAKCKGQLVGTFGDIAAFSTMYRKASIMGPTGGVVYTRNETLYFKALAHADRGKPRWRADFDDRDPSQFLFPALNLHSNEIACAIGLASLKRLPKTIDNRLAYLLALSERMNRESQACFPAPCSSEDSPFFFPIFLNSDKVNCSTFEFAKAVRAEGIGLNPHYKYLVQEWPWLTPYLADTFFCKNAKGARDRSFCLYLNENYGKQEVDDTIAAILKVEKHCLLN